MKKTITTLALAATVLLASSANAFAEHVEDTSQDKAGAGTDQCRPGPKDNVLISPWVPYTQDEFAREVLGDEYPREGFADATWAFCDKNRDGVLCVMATEPSRYSYTLLDNRPFPG
jgi:hypothetical protein